MSALVRRPPIAPTITDTIQRSSSIVDSAWSVSTNTVQRALDLLRTEGLIFGIQGKGNFVRSDIETASDQERDLQAQVAELSDGLEDVRKRLTRLERKTRGSS